MQRPGAGSSRPWPGCLPTSGSLQDQRFDLGRFYQTADHNNDAFDSDVFGIGAAYAIDEKNSVKAHFFSRSADADNADSDLFAIGYEYRLARPVCIMLAYARVANDDNANLAPWVQARTTDRPGSFGNTATGFSLALRYDF